MDTDILHESTHEASLTRSPVGTARSIVKQILEHPANRGRRIRALARAVGWQVYKRVTHRYVDIQFHGLRLRCYSDSRSASRALYFNGLADYAEMTFMRRYLRPGDIYIDVGANVGVYTLLAASIVGESGRIEAFEPGVKAVGRLRENVAINSLRQVAVHFAAVGAKPGPVRFALKQEDTRSRVWTAQDGDIETVEVPSVTLDDVLVGLGRRCAMGKMDIEGAEPLALQGAERMLTEANPPVWQLEFEGYSKAYGIATDQTVQWLAQRGYDIALYDADQCVLRFTDKPWEHGAQNVLAIARVARDTVVRRLMGLE